MLLIIFQDKSPDVGSQLSAWQEWNDRLIILHYVKCLFDLGILYFTGSTCLGRAYKRQDWLPTCLSQISHVDEDVHHFFKHHNHATFVGNEKVTSLQVFIQSFSSAAVLWVSSMIWPKNDPAACTFFKLFLKPFCFRSCSCFNNRCLCSSNDLRIL